MPISTNNAGSAINQGRKRVIRGGRMAALVAGIGVAWVVIWQITNCELRITSYESFVRLVIRNYYLILVDTSVLQLFGQTFNQFVEAFLGILAGIDILQRLRPFGCSFEEERLWRELDLHVVG